MNRGNAGETLFKSKKDRERFVKCLETAVERFSLKIHTYCLMGNHYHLLVETVEPNLSRAMQWLHVSYAAYFNRKRNRRGHLFQGRFKSILVDADEYLKELSRYIHLNPVRANLVGSASEYVWSSYSAFIGKTPAPKWLEKEWLLSQFGSRTKSAAAYYKDFVEGVKVEELEDPEKDLIGGFILGSADFAKWVEDRYLALRTEEKEIPQLKKIKSRVDLNTITKVVAAEFDCDEKTILSKGRKKNLPRDIAIYLARNLTGESGVKLGGYFGGISGAGITVRHASLSDKIRTNSKLNNKVKKLGQKIINN